MTRRRNYYLQSSFEKIIQSSCSTFFTFDIVQNNTFLIMTTRKVKSELVFCREIYSSHYSKISTIKKLLLYNEKWTWRCFPSSFKQNKMFRGEFVSRKINFMYLTRYYLLYFLTNVWILKGNIGNNMPKSLMKVKFKIT